jgi:parvulin-like peptidyl-prolyl isomerase
VAGEDWDDIYNRFAVVKDPVSKGALSVARTEMVPERDAVFAVESVGDVTPPFQAQQGWGVMRLDNIVPPAQREMNDAAQEVSNRIKRNRQDQALQAKLAEWSEEFTVIINEDALAAMPSWDELTSVQ